MTKVIELVGVEQLHIGKLTPAEIKRDYHRYLIEDVSSLFYEYRNRQVVTDEVQEIKRRVEFLEEAYHSINGRTFGIMFNTHGGYLDMLIYPL